MVERGGWGAKRRRRSARAGWRALVSELGRRQDGWSAMRAPPLAVTASFTESFDVIEMMRAVRRWQHEVLLSSLIRGIAGLRS